MSKYKTYSYGGPKKEKSSIKVFFIKLFAIFFVLLLLLGWVLFSNTFNNVLFIQTFKQYLNEQSNIYVSQILGMNESEIKSNTVIVNNGNNDNSIQNNNENTIKKGNLLLNPANSFTNKYPILEIPVAYDPSGAPDGVDEKYMIDKIKLVNKSFEYNCSISFKYVGTINASYHDINKTLDSDEHGVIVWRTVLSSEDCYWTSSYW